MIRTLRCCAFILSSLFFAPIAQADDTSPAAPVVQQDSVPEHEKVAAFLLKQTPLMVIRFNRPHLAYDESVKKIVQQAHEARDNVSFILIGRIPKTDEPAFTQKSQVFLSQHIAHIQDLLQQSRVPRENIQEYLVLDSPTGFNEIALFVQ